MMKFFKRITPCLLVLPILVNAESMPTQIGMYEPSNATCNKPIFQNIKEGMEEGLMQSPMMMFLKGIANSFDMTCVGSVMINPDIGHANLEFVKPGDNVKSWQELLTLQTYRIPASRMSADGLAEGMMKTYKKVGATSNRFTPDVGGLRQGLTCLEYAGTSPGQNQSKIGAEFGVSCIYRVNDNDVLIALRQSRNPLDASMKNDFVKKFNDQLIAQ